MAETEFKDIIRSARLAAGLSQGELGHRIGKDQPYISDIEKGRNRNPDVTMVKKLSWELNIPEAELFAVLGVPVTIGAAVTIPVRGVIPADHVRWVAADSATVSEIHVVEEDLRHARYPKDVYGLEVVGDCMRAIRIWPGDIIIVEPPNDRLPKNGDLVVVRVEDEYSLKRWSQFNEQVELRDGDDTIVWRGRTNEVEVIAFYVTWKPPAPR